ncbi:olfactory receptor 13-like [Boleophthalmus pectinirostris]|uniref:olfactory receptor 13-like n=1 Tax=Boleophthalmus pectinirostris TaxID=150288 RepID=UPI002430FFB2|nr:olfactory receptor 13-like [Boleophthalmus pectinirostris]
MENVTWNSPVLLLEGFSLPPLFSLCVFVFLLLCFVFILGANTMVVCAVISDRRLHTSMYLLICNLAVIDILANVNVLPRVLLDMLRPPPARLITYAECVTQAFWSHLLATGVRTVLMVMAFDRYVAVCLPLRYASIMSPRMLAKLLVAAWSAALVLVSVLIGLTVPLSRCRVLVVGLFCSNAALFGLSCESIYVNNVYGLTFTSVLYVTSAGSMVLTYGSIITVSVQRDRALNPKALRTCLSHLLVYFLTLVSGLTLILFTRFPELRQERLLASALYFALPGCLNPLIYGLQSHEIRNYVRTLFQGKRMSDRSH